MTTSLHAFANRQDLVSTLADRIADRLREGVSARGEALFLATGGVTPIPLYEALSSRPLPWDRVIVLPSDARWLPEDQDGSNDGMIRRTLLRGAAARARLLPLYDGEPSPEAALPRLRALIAGLPRPDVALLGIGEDGHTASFFKGAEGFAQAVDPDGEDTIMAIHAPTGAMTPHRLTATLSYLVKARSIEVMFFGDAKRALYEAALEPGPIEDLPIRAVLRQDRAPVGVYWAA
jgi:6-phosphogluconolactonase